MIRSATGSESLWLGEEDGDLPARSRFGEGRSDQEPSAFGNRSEVAVYHCGLGIMHRLTLESAFYLAASLRQIKNRFSASFAPLR
jgi:hypothetical protein